MRVKFQSMNVIDKTVLTRAVLRTFTWRICPNQRIESISTSSPSVAEPTSESVTTVDNAALSAQRLGDNLQQKEFEIIAATLEEEQGSRKNTAERLGVSPRTLRYKLAKMRELGML